MSLYQQGEWSPLAYVDLTEPKLVWKTLSICPAGLTNDKTTEKLLSVVGNGGESFTVQIAEGASEISLDETHTDNVQGDEVSVFQFIPRGISDKQLDITATSESKVAAYLKVSQNCKEVDLQEDLESIDYKKESLRLSFARKGRITLSRVSIPPLTDSVSGWFIGIGLKNLSGDVKLSESKNVTLKLTRSFDYNYATPICVLVFVSFLVGILVSIFAYFLFEESLTKVNVGEGEQGNDNVDLKISDLWKVFIGHWSSSVSKSYAFITGIVGNLLIVIALQFVIISWDVMIQQGDRDNCYYNDFCYRVLYHDIPFNLMITNLTYIVHGLILFVWVLILETKAKLRSGAAVEGRYSFSIAYAFSWALVFQGLCSALYHLCPSVYTFQFDSAFMFIIAGLIVLLLYSGIKQNRFFDAPKFFLFVIMPLFIFNCFSLLLDSNDGPNKIIQWWFFYAPLVIWWLVMVSWAFHNLNIHQMFGGNYCEIIFNGFLFILAAILMPTLMACLMSDLAQVLLNACIFCSIVAITAKFLKKLSKSEFGKSHGKGNLQILFILLTFSISVAAFYVFICLPTTNKTSLPENSRGHNEECVILGFFDWHDLWHFLSSFALLMGAFVVLFLSSEPEPKQHPQPEKRKAS